MVLGAQALGEFGDDPNRFEDAKSRKNYPGMSPITRASGKNLVVLARYAATNDSLTLASSGRSLPCQSVPALEPSTTNIERPATPTTAPCEPSPTASWASSTAAYATAPSTTNTPVGPPHHDRRLTPSGRGMCYGAPDELHAAGRGSPSSVRSNSFARSSTRWMDPDRAARSETSTRAASVLPTRSGVCAPYEIQPLPFGPRGRELGSDQARIHSHCNHPCVAKLDRHVRGEPVEACLASAVGRVEVVALSARRGDVGDQRARCCSEQKRCRMPARHVVGSESDADLVVPDRQRVFPEATRPSGRIGDRVHVVDEQVEVALLAGHPLEQRGDLRVVPVVGGHRNARAAALVDESCGCVDRELRRRRSNAR